MLKRTDSSLQGVFVATRKEVAFVEDACEASPMNTVLIMTLSPTTRATLPHRPPRALLTFAWPLRRESRSRLLQTPDFIADSSRPGATSCRISSSASAVGVDAWAVAARVTRVAGPHADLLALLPSQGSGVVVQGLVFVALVPVMPVRTTAGECGCSAADTPCRCK